MTFLFDIPVNGQKRIIIFEAETGVHREDFFREQLSQLTKARTWYLNSNLNEGGSWAGVNVFFESLFEELEKDRPELIVEHDYELTMLMPRLRDSIKVRNQSLTDEAMGEERVRNYPVDRAFRIQHGLINLLKEWRAGLNQEPWVVLCDHHNYAGSLAGPFFIELARRAGELLNITIVLVRDRGSVASLQEQLELYELPYHLCTAPIPKGYQIKLSQEEAKSQALALDKKVSDDLIEREVNYPKLISLWKAAGNEEQALKATIVALSFCNHNGFYYDGAHYVDYVLPRIEMFAKGVEQKRFYILGLIYHPYAVTGRSQDALRIFLDEGVPYITNPELKARMYYALAMLHARFLEQRDAEKAEQYLEGALGHLEEAEIGEESRFFLRVFLKNGLALVRVRQGRAREALELCSWGFNYLDEHLDPQRHRLHRSVLLYNTAQVYARTHQPKKALEFYNDALEMDPNYSEYHNERGNVYQEMGLYTEALKEYQLAVSLSAPYHEVHYNMGRCYFGLGDLKAAIRSYQESLELNPNQPEAWINLAEIFEQAHQLEAALMAYEKAAHWAENPADIYANRAVLLYSMERFDESLKDLDRAVAADPQCAELYQNRAIAHEALDNIEAAVQDLHTYLKYCPNGEDREEVRFKIVSLSTPV